MALIWLGLLAGLAMTSILFGGYIVGVQGRPVPGDFFDLWSAGRIAWSVPVAQVYLRQLFVYPPLLFLFVVMGLALLPYTAAFATWSLGTLAAYSATVKTIFRDRRTAIALGAAPACFFCFIVAQNGLFTAALFGAFLLSLKKHPILSGVLLAALAYKPQFGLIVPFALIAGGHWRTFLTAAAILGAGLLIWHLTAPAVIPAYLATLNYWSDLALTRGATGWQKLQSVYSLMRLIGAGGGAAKIVQGAVAVAAAVGVVAAWRSRLAYCLKAAVLIIGALAATPYDYIYDFPLLSVAVGFLYREAAFDRRETVLVWSAYGAIAAFAVTPAPFGLIALALVGTVIVRRLQAAANRSQQPVQR